MKATEGKWELGWWDFILKPVRSRAAASCTSFRWDSHFQSVRERSELQKCSLDNMKVWIIFSKSAWGDDWFDFGNDSFCGNMTSLLIWKLRSEWNITPETLTDKQWHMCYMYMFTINKILNPTEFTTFKNLAVMASRLHVLNFMWVMKSKRETGSKLCQ